MFDIKKAEENAWRYVLKEAQENGDRKRLAGALVNCDGHVPEFVRKELAGFIEVAKIPKGVKSAWTNRIASRGRRYADQIRILFNDLISSGHTKTKAYEELAKMAPLSIETIRDIVERRKTFRGDS